MTQKSEWPDFFPDGVPPENAIPAAGKAFRIVASIPPTDSDFLSNVEKYPDRSYGENLWMACGLSFHRQLECSKRTRKRFPALRKCRIALGILKPEHGVQLETGNRKFPSHFTVWKRQDALIQPDFAVDGEENGLSTS
ncbi:MAG: hypothetical protein J7647_00395 [Cyanobacteria bacterium SBLK]|nr:hypothetical protein [Cyanobacteria bacterium SBLK]